MSEFFVNPSTSAITVQGIWTDPQGQGNSLVDNSHNSNGIHIIKKIKAGENITIDSTAHDITINATSVGGGTVSASEIAEGTVFLASQEETDAGLNDTKAITALKLKTTGFAQEQIPNLDASKITTGTFDAGKIPNLDASKITTGTLAQSRGGQHLTGNTTDPTTTDDATGGFLVGSRWINTSNDKEFVCLDNTLNTAVWKETTVESGGGGASSLNDLTDVVKTSNPQQGDDAHANLFIGEAQHIPLAISSTKNIGIGTYSSRYISTGNGNIGIGFGSNGTVASGSRNIGIGAGTNGQSVSESNNISIGDGTYASVGGSDCITIGTGLINYRANSLCLPPSLVEPTLKNKVMVQDSTEGTVGGIQGTSGQVLGMTDNSTVGFITPSQFSRIYGMISGYAITVSFNNPLALFARASNGVSLTNSRITLPTSGKYICHFSVSLSYNDPTSYMYGNFIIYQNGSLTFYSEDSTIDMMYPACNTVPNGFYIKHQITKVFYVNVLTSAYLEIIPQNLINGSITHASLYVERIDNYTGGA